MLSSFFSSMVNPASLCAILLLTTPIEAARIEQKRATTACNADLCLRAINPSTKLSSASQACSTFFALSNAATAVPTYASACSGAVRFASACSCIGVSSGSVSTSGTSSTTSTSSTSTTSSVTVTGPTTTSTSTGLTTTTSLGASTVTATTTATTTATSTVTLLTTVTTTAFTTTQSVQTVTATNNYTQTITSSNNSTITASSTGLGSCDTLTKTSYNATTTIFTQLTATSYNATSTIAFASTTSCTTFPSSFATPLFADFECNIPAGWGNVNNIAFWPFYGNAGSNSALSIKNYPDPDNYNIDATTKGAYPPSFATNPGYLYRAQASIQWVGTGNYTSDFSFSNSPGVLERYIGPVTLTPGQWTTYSFTFIAHQTSDSLGFVFTAANGWPQSQFALYLIDDASVVLADSTTNYFTQGQLGSNLISNADFAGAGNSFAPWTASYSTSSATVSSVSSPTYNGASSALNITFPAPIRDRVILTQSVTVTPGTVYRVGFAYQFNQPITDDNVCYARLDTVGLTAETLSTVTADTSTPLNTWAYASNAFVATASSGTIRVTVGCLGGMDSFIIGGVELVPVSSR